MSDREPFAPWLPTYAQVIKKWPKYGFDGLVINGSLYPILAERRVIISERFFERYATRMINQETLQRWQLRLQNKMDEIAAKYERAYTLYVNNAERMNTDITDGYRLDNTAINRRGGKDTVKNTSSQRDIDTPDKAINHDKNYADRVIDNDSVNETDYDSNTASHSDTEYSATGNFIEKLNKSVDDYRDLDTAFITEFENNFLNILWD